MGADLIMLMHLKMKNTAIDYWNFFKNLFKKTSVIRLLEWNFKELIINYVANAVAVVIWRNPKKNNKSWGLRLLGPVATDN